MEIAPMLPEIRAKSNLKPEESAGTVFHGLFRRTVVMRHEALSTLFRDAYALIVPKVMVALAERSDARWIIFPLAFADQI